MPGVLDSLLDGMKSAGWAPPDAVYVPNQNAIAILSGAPPPPRPSMASGLLG